MFHTLFILCITLAFGARLEPATSALNALKTAPSGGRRNLEGSDLMKAAELSDGHGGVIVREDQYYQGIRVDGVHSTEHIVNGETVDITGWVVTHIEEDIPSVADLHRVDLDLLMQPYNCEDVKYEEVIEFRNDVAILAYKVDCWTAFDAQVNGIHRWRMEFDAATGELLSMVDSIDHQLPKTADRRRLAHAQDLDAFAQGQDFVDVGSLEHGCETILSDSLTMIDDGTVLHIIDCLKGADSWRMEFDARTGEMNNQYRMKTRRNLALETMTGYGGNERTGQLTHESLKIQRDGNTCTYSSDFVDVVHNEFTESRYMTTPYSFPCSDLPEQTDAINGAYSPLNDASAYGEVVYDMFQNWYNMEALPFKLSMRVHYGDNWENAMWDGSAMYFGDGQSYFHPLVSLGVTAHEVSHGVTEYAADLIYSGQSGGLNEAFSDMSAAAAEFYYWGETEYEMGSKIAKGQGAMRYMCDPTRDGRSIDHVNDFTSGMDVHHSSGVFNKVFCELSSLDNWGPRKTFNLFLTANKAYWEKDSNFQEAADLTMAAATALEYELEDICNSFTIVGLTAQGCSTNPTYSPVGSPTEACADVRTNVELHTDEWALEITWELEGTSCASDREYTDGTVHHMSCCLPAGDYVLNCRDSYGDGWNNAFLVIDGVEYCRQFAAGYLQTAAVTIGDQPGQPTRSPVSRVPTYSPVTSEPTSRVPTYSPVTSQPTSGPVTSTPSMSPVGNPTEQCQPTTVQLHTSDWSNEITWDIEGTSCESDRIYFPFQTYEKTCCIPVGNYVLNCKDSFGDGWHGAYMVIDGVEYCREFESGILQSNSITIDNQAPSQPPVSIPSPSRSPVTSQPTFSPSNPPVVPCRMQTVKLFTLFYAHEIEWEMMGVSDCSSVGHEFDNDSVYEFECCIPDETVTLKCMNSMGDGWHHGYLEIEGNKFCQDPFGFEETVDISFPLEQPTGCRDVAPTHVCEKIMGRGWCEHVKSNDFCAETCNQCEM